MTTVGDRISWLKLDSRATREWAMVPMAMSLGLDIGSFIASEAADALPKRKVIQSTMHGCLGKKDVYGARALYP